jgi:hypothetical protein
LILSQSDVKGIVWPKIKVLGLTEYRGCKCCPE